MVWFYFVVLFPSQVFRHALFILCISCYFIILNGHIISYDLRDAMVRYISMYQPSKYIHWLMNSLTDRLIDWSPDWQIDWLIDYRLIDWLTDWLIGWLANWLNYWLTYLLIGWLTGWLINWLTDKLAEWLIDWLTDWLTTSVCWVCWQLDNVPLFHGRLSLPRNS
jgi:hypothetical protein